MQKGTFFKSAAKLADKFLMSDIYPFVIAAMVYVFWATQTEIAGLLTFVVIASLIIALKRDMLPTIPILFTIAMIFPKAVDPLSYGAWVFGVLGLLPLSVVVHFIRFRGKLSLGKMFYPQLAVSVALLVGGLGAIEAVDYMRGFAYGMLLGFAILALYFAYYRYICPSEKVDIKRYTAMVMTAVGMLLVFEMFTFYYRNPEVFQRVGDPTNLGWGISNNVATLLLLTIPFTMYLASRTKHPVIYIIMTLLQYVAMVLTWSRGGLLAAGIVFPFLFVYTSIKVKPEGRLVYYLSIAAVLVVSISLFYAYYDKAWPVLKSAFSQGTGASGRDLLYAEAWECFKQNPLFGAGLGHNGPNYNIDIIPMYWFHSTFFQVIGSMGLIGVAAYAYYYIARYSIVIKKAVFNGFALLAFLGFEIYSMMDTGTFIPMPMMVMVVFLTMLMEFSNRQPIPKAYPYNQNTSREELPFSVEFPGARAAYPFNQYTGEEELGDRQPINQPAVAVKPFNNNN